MTGPPSSEDSDAIRQAVADAAGVVDALGPKTDRDQRRTIARTAMRLATEPHDRLDLKITAAALSEMRRAYAMFAPHRGRRKVTIFGSARTRPDDPLYGITRHLAARLAEAGWMVVTGAGPGIMAAGMAGAGRDQALGVNIRLPFEQVPSEHVDEDKLVEMRYFFTRKLMLMKESSAFVALPGGFGTLDETFELLTLQQTGKSVPAAVVLLDRPGGRYWTAWRDFLSGAVAEDRYIDPADLNLVSITDDVDEAVATIERFHAVFHSSRYVGDRLVLRVAEAPGPADVEAWSTEFGDILEGPITVESGPLPGEHGELPDLPRVVLAFDRRGHGRLRQLIDRINDGRRP
ncbi:MAG TPA: TIGR00730 family Rossman fold protein [Acidimicrobiales bacterium]